MVNIIPKFDEAGNIILKKPQTEDVDPEIMKEILAAGQAIKNSVDMVKEYESETKIEDLKEELEEIVNGKEKFPCQFCEKNWKSKVSKERHEVWCPKNPNHRVSYRKPTTEVKKKPKNTKTDKPKPKSKDIIKELKAFDKIFGLTDEQIAKYIRGLMK